MAKRRRLNPAQPTYLSAASLPAATSQPALRAGLSVPPPIAQVAGEASAVAALREVSAALDAARTEGRLLLRLPLAAIEADYLVRDRLVADADDMAYLVASIAEHGQRQPIEVAELGSGRYGLISGWRRLRALGQLAEKEGMRFGTVLAQLRHPDTAASAYVAMIEENEIRVGLSYYERARVTAKAVEAGVFPTEKAALLRLFSAASRSRRSKIGSFLAIHRHLDTVLRFPAALPERLGLALARLLEGDPALARPLAATLAAKPAQIASEEQSCLALFVAEQSRADAVEPVFAQTEPLLSLNYSLDDPRFGSVPMTALPRASNNREIRPGLFLRVSGDWTNPTLKLSGPALDPVLRDRLETWLATGH